MSDEEIADYVPRRFLRGVVLDMVANDAGPRYPAGGVWEFSA
ncbi:MAG TPA: hypothetical protein VJ750_10780 [Rhizomicrobium sp.]|nr:hypothetical protein [Rhizomicrobium sp.]